MPSATIFIFNFLARSITSETISIPLSAASAPRKKSASSFKTSSCNSFNELSGIEEERRLCYVAVTRAKKTLELINARKRTIFGQESYNMPSRFINEVDSSALDIDIKEKEVKIVDKKCLIDETQEYSIGDKVEHDTFGVGVIVSVNKSILTIAFKNSVGIKTLMKGHKSIRKV